MQQLITGPLSLLLCLSVLSGCLIHETQLDSVATVAMNSEAKNIDNVAALSKATPNIDTNWFSSSSSVSSEQPKAQTRDDENNQHIAQGRILGESYGNDRP